ncbi:hypothetical protein LPTSP4_09470 [Leptospira ryugenii]|uniref:Uncharacterized protein n=1 Tax=Leptospira ryugenii TaxID=1917863 RepID=A0A2P2DXT3_9LEPT|nr:hypothetical protein [Leptospira ryugenii]GBF49434.1 hypothetical protein LPTSP4_09470 [Leptospira ryugenii]
MNEKTTVEKVAKDYFTQTELKNRGWTNKAIMLFYSEPDLLKNNPRYASAPKMKLYDIDKVKEIESSEEFTQFQERNQKRVLGAEKAISTKYEKTLEEIENFKVEIPILPERKLFKLAIENYNENQMARGNFHKFANLDSDTDFLHRITVNYIRHVLTDYEMKLQEIKRRVGSGTAYEMLRKKVFTAIKEAYPYLIVEDTYYRNF